MPKRHDAPAASAVLKKRTERPKMPAKRPRVTPNAHQLPETIPAGEILTDVGKKQWRLGKPIGVGGFGRIYAASDDVTTSVTDNAPYVIKMEPHGNGPLFIEMHFYHRAAKAEMIEDWKAKKKLKFLGMPKFVASGSCEYKLAKYRFMVMERFGYDLQRLFELNKKTFSIKTVFTVGQKVIDILEYIHSTGYIHADIKGSNLLLGFGKGHEDEVFLVDFGLACKFVSDGKHKVFTEDPRKAHDGTIEFTSRDAHVGAHSRRGDFEILGYNMLQWLCGRLPWEDNLKDPAYVTLMKNKYMADIPLLMKMCFKKTQYPDAIEKFLEYVVKLRFEEDPGYVYCKKLFADCLKKYGLPNNGKLDLDCSQSPTKRKVKQEIEFDHENAQCDVPTKQPRSGIRKPCGLAQTNRVKKSSPRQKKLNESVGKSKAAFPVRVTIGGQVATPAMLRVMQLRGEKLQQQQVQELKAKQMGRGRSRSNSSSSSKQESLGKAPGCLTRRQVRRSSSLSPFHSKRFSTSPELF